jgi:hypothetical protein
VAPEAFAEFEAMVKEKRAITMNEIAGYLDMGQGPLVHDFLQFHKY